MQGVLSVSLLLSLFLFAGCESSKQEPFTLTIAHVNDIHSHLESEPYTFFMDLDANGSHSKVGVELGGMPRVVSKIKEIQSQNKNVLTLNAGDLIQGTLYFTVFEGDASVAMYNQVVWDAFEVGNHEWDRGDAFLGQLLSQFHSGVVLGANIKPDGVTMLMDAFTPYSIKKFGDVKVGIVGIDVVQKTEASSEPSEHITFLPEEETAQKYIDILIEQGVNKIVLLSHVGYENDIKYAKELHGVDIIVGGDSHTLFGDYSYVGIETKVHEYPLIVKNADNQNVCIVQAWSYSHAVGELSIIFDKEGNVEHCSGADILPLGDSFTLGTQEVNASIKEKIIKIFESKKNIEIVTKDKATLKALEPFKSEIDKKADEVVGYAKYYLSNQRVPSSSYPHGSELAPLVCQAFMLSDANANLCIQNAGAIRTPLSEGAITIESVYALLPFQSTLFEIRMKGSKIKEVLEDALSNYYDNGGSSGSFPYAYALRYDINATASKGSRVSNIQIMDKESGVFSNIESDTLYIVITNNYIASGHDGYDTFKSVQEERGPGIDTYLDYAMSFIDFVKAKEALGEELERLGEEKTALRCYTDADFNSCKE